MKSSRSAVLAATTTAVIAILAASAPPADAQGLFDRLFRQSSRVDQRPPQPPAAVEPAPARRAVPRVSGPQYYTYKTDSLMRVDFSAIKPPAVADEAGQGASLPEPEGLDPSSVGSTVAASAEEAAREEEDASPPPVADVARLDEAEIAALQDFELFAEKEAAEAIVAHYSADPRFLWIDDGAPNARAREALRVMGEAAAHGLDPRDYQVSLPAAADDAAAFEMELSARVLRYARDARSGRIDPNRISGYHDFKPKELDAASVLASLHDIDDAADFLERQHPQNPQYAALRAELEVLRASAENDIIIESGTVIRPGESSPEFPKILALIDRHAGEEFRQEHGETLSGHRDDETYAQALVPAIKAAQKAAGVGDDGIIGPRTILAIAGESRAARIEKVQVALEQARWLPSRLADRHVFINTPAFEATYVEDGREKLSMRTVVGTLSTQTYFFQDEISYVEFHPYWGMPRSILVNTYLPRVLKDPSYLDRNGFEVTDGNGRVVSSTAIDWGAYGANIPFNVRQRPGPRNALGEMKIMFPNRHAIYMHDTPDRHLFDRDNRALSNGCIRLDDPRAMAAAVLGWTREEVEARLARPHSRENLEVKVPVYVAYFTAWPDEKGEVRYFNDVYGRDEKTRAAIDKVAALRAPGA